MKSKTIIGIVLFLAVLIGAYFGYQKLSQQHSASSNGQGTANAAASQREAAPDIAVYDETGKEVRLSDFRGKPVIVNFWASWCPPCRREMPDFQAEYLKEKDNVVFFMVNLTSGQRESEENARQFLADNGYTFPVYFDKTGAAAQAYQIRSVPMTVLVDENGYLLKQHTGIVNAATLQSYLLLLKN